MRIESSVELPQEKLGENYQSVIAMCLQLSQGSSLIQAIVYCSRTWAQGVILVHTVSRNILHPYFQIAALFSTLVSGVIYISV